jgi:hypothetical protein
VLAYKWLGENGRSVISGFRWPLPQGGRPGDWLDVEGDLVLCRNGVHACRVNQLAHWLGAGLWVVELGGRIIDVEGMLVSSRARLVEAVGAWAEAARTDFAWACTIRARGLGPPSEYPAELDDLAGFARSANAAAAGYLGAHLRGRVTAGGSRTGVDFDRGFAEERTLQAEWLAERLGLVDDPEQPGTS